MDFHPIEGLPTIHEVPFPEIRFEGAELDVWVDRADDQRLLLRFTPIQAIRVTTVDCASLDFNPLPVGTIAEVADSPWIERLRADLAERDSGATFLDKSHHYAFWAGDQLIEVVAWTLTCETA